jgi:hypothetical protein
VGVTDFVLKRLRSFQGVASTACTVVEISRAALEVMVTEVPEVATAMQVGTCHAVGRGLLDTAARIVAKWFVCTTF